MGCYMPKTRDTSSTSTSFLHVLSVCQLNTECLTEMESDWRVIQFGKTHKDNMKINDVNRVAMLKILVTSGKNPGGITYQQVDVDVAFMKDQKTRSIFFWGVISRYFLVLFSQFKSQRSLYIKITLHYEMATRFMLFFCLPLSLWVNANILSSVHDLSLALSITYLALYFHAVPILNIQGYLKCLQSFLLHELYTFTVTPHSSSQYGWLLFFKGQLKRTFSE